MLLDEFLAPRILIVSGKGGVGKTTVAASLALVAARRGRKVCIAEVDRKGTLPKLFGGRELAYEPRQLSPGVWALNIALEDALAEYLRVQYHMSRVSKILTSTHFVDYVTTAAPGLKDILVLGKIWYLEQNRTGTTAGHSFDTIIVDAPAAGHMVTFLSAPSGLSDAVRGGPVARQAGWLVDMLRDSRRTRSHLVTLAEEMPVAESLETAATLRDRFGIHQGAVFANAIYPQLLSRREETALEQMSGADELRREAQRVRLSLDAEDEAALLGYAHWRRARRAIQARYVRKLRKELTEPVAELPLLFSAGLALPDIEVLADVIEDRVEAL